MTDRPPKTLIEIRITSARWSEIWGIGLYAGQPFIITEDQIRLPDPQSPPRKVCMFSYEQEQLTCTIIDRSREAYFNMEARSEAVCRTGDRIFIGETTLIEILQAPPPKGSAALPGTFENGLERIFHSLEDALTIPTPLEDGANPPSASGPQRPVFVDHRNLEVPEPTVVLPPPTAASGPAALRARSFADLQPVPLAAHRPDPFLRPKGSQAPSRQTRPHHRGAQRAPRRKNRVSILLLILLGITLALFVSER